VVESSLVLLYIMSGYQTRGGCSIWRRRIPHAKISPNPASSEIAIRLHENHDHHFISYRVYTGQSGQLKIKLRKPTMWLYLQYVCIYESELAIRPVFITMYFYSIELRIASVQIIRSSVVLLQCRGLITLTV
jgi:hypothetical protein